MDVQIHSKFSSSESMATSNGSFQSAFTNEENQGKLFVGGLSMSTTDGGLFAYFEKFGQVKDAVIMYDLKTSLPRGFGFVTFLNPASAEKVLLISQHYLDGKKIDPQPAIANMSPARSVNNTFKKVFIGGVSPYTTEEYLKEYFTKKFGEVEDLVLKLDYVKQQHRGFGFVTFVSPAVADRVCAVRNHWIHSKFVECKKAQQKGKVTKLSGPTFKEHDHETVKKMFEGYSKIKSQESNNSSDSSPTLETPPEMEQQTVFVPNFRQRIAKKYGVTTSY